MSAVPLPRRPASPLTDALHRPLKSLRISVTDRCNMRCRYCMPEQEYAWLPRESILTFEEIDRLVGIFAALGVDKLRLTGGEPLLRHQLPNLVRLLRRHRGIRDIALTTNGILLARYAEELRDSGLSRVTVSLDTLRPDRMLEFARSGRHHDVLQGIAAARRSGLEPVKLNVVVVRGYNDDELVDLVEFARAERAEVRFIEYMDVGGATEWSMDRVVSRHEMLERLAQVYGVITPIHESGWAPAERFALQNGAVIGIIASTPSPNMAKVSRPRPSART